MTNPECEGECIKHRKSATWMLIGRGKEVRYNAIAEAYLCSYCQDQWSAWWTEGFARPGWVKKGLHRPGER